MAKEIQKKDAGALAAPGMFSRADVQAMYGDMEREDVSIPRLVLVQSTSPEFDEKLAAPGEFFIKSLARNLGQKELEIIPLFHTKSRLRWRALGDGGGVTCQATDGKNGTGDPGGDCATCKFSQWTQTAKGNSKGPECDLYQNIICVLRQDEEWMPIALSGARTKLKPLKDLNSMLVVERAKGRPIFAKSYLVRPVEKQNQVGKKYFTFRIVPGNENKVLPEAEQNKAFALFQSLKGANISIDQERDEKEPTDQSEGKF